MAQELTKRQQQVLDYVIERIEVNGYPPTIREIGQHMKIRSTNGVSDHLRALERKGYLVRDESKSRALRPVKVRPRLRSHVQNDEIHSVPLLGRIAAGDPITAFEDSDDNLSIDASLLGGGGRKGLFALRVRGDSMIGDGIFDRDLIFVRRQHTAERGDIVVALIEDEATVKRYDPRGDEIHFLPSNPDMEPIVVKRSEFRETQLLGVVVAMYRRLQ